MTTLTPDIEQLAADIAAAMPSLAEADQQLARYVYGRLATGQAVPLADLVEHLGESKSQVDERLAAWPGVTRDANGAITSFWGLALSGMPHGFTVDGVALTTWCAWDAFFIPGIIQKTATAQSRCPVTAEPVSLCIAPQGMVSQSPTTARISIQRPAKPFGDDVVPSF